MFNYVSLLQTVKILWYRTERIFIWYWTPFRRHDIKKQKNYENKKAVQAEDLPSLFMGEC